MEKNRTRPFWLILLFMVGILVGIYINIGVTRRVMPVSSDFNKFDEVMWRIGEDYVDEIYCGDSINTKIKDESVDIEFFRFLNSEVVTTEYAYLLFEHLYKKVKKNGIIVIFGHTPVLMKKEFFIKLGLKVVQSIAYDKDYDCIFQYYVLRRV